MSFYQLKKKINTEIKKEKKNNKNTLNYDGVYLFARLKV